MPTTPQDRKPAKNQPFRFTDSEGKSHTLPLASKGHAKMTGGDVEDAALGGDVGQLVYLFKVLNAAEPNPKAKDALRAMPQNDMLEVLKAWGEHGDGDGASLGK